MAQVYDYVIVGGGLAGASAIEGLRELDVTGNILLIGEEAHLPYDRPPLSKDLWLGKQKIEEVFLHDRSFYEQHTVTLSMDTRAERLDPEYRTLHVSGGKSFQYGKLLLATGCRPRQLDIPGADAEGICYFRGMDDYLHLHGMVAQGKSAVIVGGGFIGSELAAALNVNKVDVTMIFPGATLCDRVFPDYLGHAVQQRFQEKGVKIMAFDQPVSFDRRAGKYVTHTKRGATLESDIVIIGVGVVPNMELAESGKLETNNGIRVNEYLQTSRPDIYAAGDNAWFPCWALGRQMRIEHWDHALNQGRLAGRNMAGANEPYSHQSMFFSDLFEFGYEATGEVDARLDTFADWQKENDTGVIYYLRDGKVRGVMLCNVWDRIDVARELIRKGEPMTPDKLRGLIR